MSFVELWYKQKETERLLVKMRIHPVTFELLSGLHHYKRTPYKKCTSGITSLQEQLKEMSLITVCTIYSTFLYFRQFC